MRKPHSMTLWLLLGMILLGAGGAATAAELRDFDGNPARIGDFTGQERWLVVMLWASDCPVCNAEVHQYNDFHTFHADSDARVLGISLDGAAKQDAAREFIRRHEVIFPNLIGEPADVAGLYRQLVGRPFAGTPTFLIYDPAGDLVAQQVGAVPVNLIEEFIGR